MPELVPESANLLFRLCVKLFGEVDNKEWEGIRPALPIGLSLEGDGGLDMSGSLDPLPVLEREPALPRLSVRDREAIFAFVPRSMPGALEHVQLISRALCGQMAACLC